MVTSFERGGAIGIRGPLLVYNCIDILFYDMVEVVIRKRESEKEDRS